MSKRHRRPCPTATKTPFRDKIAAEAALVEIRRMHDREPIAEKIPVRSYHCECGQWHLTSSSVPYADRPTVTAPIANV